MEKTDLGFSEPFKFSTTSMHYCNRNRKIFIFKDRFLIDFRGFFYPKIIKTKRILSMLRVNPLLLRKS